MSSPITALVTIRYQWVRTAGLERLLLHLADNLNSSLTGTLVLPVTRYHMSDPSFVEVAFRSPAMELEGTLFVPKAEVIAILKTDDPSDLPKIGYRGRAASDAMDLECVPHPPPPDVPN
jgi:hypothetical protein